eukprot:TRINITY_DN20679_c0_g3_i2.p1 TRINITY_DN20679_c0_g3~~TRINITY_DN20679_c0_g3_i2.p1  ORF type:complete len:645 (-),score=151.09 TRINITY_DN20679_c0_g3_i2:310-2244(-)
MADNNPAASSSRKRTASTQPSDSRPEKRIRKDAVLPIRVDNILNYRDMLGKYLQVDNPRRIWFDNRAALNNEGRILVTSEIIGFIDMLRSNFVDNDGESKWDGLLVRGMSGAGKSVAFALGASYLNALDIFDVYWFRTAEDYTPLVSYDLQNYIEDDERVRIIFVDQADKLDRLESFIGYGSQTKGVFTIGCASGNARVPPSSSRATRVHELVYDPTIDYKIFQTFFNQSNDEIVSLSLFKNTQAMLDHKVSDFPSLYIGTCGHFLSMARFRKVFAENSKFGLAWSSLLQFVSSEMLVFFSMTENREKSILFYLHLQKVILLNNSLKPSFPAKIINLDDRYVHNSQIFSPLFVQAYRLMLLLCPPPNTLCASLVAMKWADNPTVKGFCVERYIITQIDKLLKFAKDILCRNDIRFANTEEEYFDSGIYAFEGSWSIPEDVHHRSANLRIWIFIPLKWNEDGVDAVLVCTRDSKAAVIGVQVTLQTASNHSKSLRWFCSNEFEKQLKSLGYDVLNMLLFICKAAATELKTGVQEVKGKPVFEYPLHAIVPDGLDVPKSNSEGSLTRLKVNLESATYLGHSNISRADMTSLRSFCLGYGDAKIKSKREGQIIALAIHRKLEPLCKDCFGQGKNSTLFPLKRHLFFK